MLCSTPNSTLSSSDIPYKRSLGLNVIGSAATIAIALTSILGNTAVVTVSYWNEALRVQTGNVLIVYLAVTDILTALFVMLPSAIAVSSDTWVLGHSLCKANATFNYMFYCSSSTNISLISLDRLVAVVYPLRYATWMTGRLVFKLCGGLLLQSLIVGTLSGLPDWTVYDYQEGVCAVIYSSGLSDMQSLAIVSGCCCFFVPAVIMGVCNAIIIIKANRSKKTAQNLFVKRSNLTSEMHMRKTIKSLLVVVLTYYVCYSPYAVTKQVKIHTGCSGPAWFNYFISILIFIASAANPFIYGIFRKDYREAFKKLFKCLLRKCCR